MCFVSRLNKTFYVSRRVPDGAWFKKGSGTVVRSTLRAVPATVPDPFLNHAPLGRIGWHGRPVSPCGGVGLCRKGGWLRAPDTTQGIGCSPRDPITHSRKVHKAPRAPGGLPPAGCRLHQERSRPSSRRSCLTLCQSRLTLRWSWRTVRRSWRTSWQCYLTLRHCCLTLRQCTLH